MEGLYLMNEDQLTLPLDTTCSSIKASKNKDLTGMEKLGVKVEKQFMQDFLAWKNPYGKIRTKTVPERKWRLVSGLQKSIRRGEVVTAIRCANALLGVDPSYFWNRLVVIALEDIGPVKPVAYLLLASQGVKWRSQFNQRDLAFFLVEQLASSPVKTRALTDLMLVAEFKTMKNRLRELVDGGSVPHPYLTAHENAGLSAVYANLKIGQLPGDYDFSKDKFTGMVEKAQAPCWVRWIALRSRSACRHPFFHVVLPVYWAMEAVTTHVVEEAKKPTEMLQGIPIASYDQHTQEGKRALAYFSKSCKPVRKWLAEHPHLKKIDALGSVVFYVEGELLDRRTSWLDNEDDRRWVQKVWSYTIGFKADEHEELENLVLENMEELNHARKRVLGVV